MKEEAVCAGPERNRDPGVIRVSSQFEFPFQQGPFGCPIRSGSGNLVSTGERSLAFCLVNEERIVRCEFVAPSGDIVDIDPGVSQCIADPEGVSVLILWVDGSVGIANRVIESLKAWLARAKKIDSLEGA